MIKMSTAAVAAVVSAPDKSHLFRTTFEPILILGLITHIRRRIAFLSKQNIPPVRALLLENARNFYVNWIFALCVDQTSLRSAFLLMRISGESRPGFEMF